MNLLPLEVSVRRSRASWDVSTGRVQRLPKLLFGGINGLAKLGELVLEAGKVLMHGLEASKFTERSNALRPACLQIAYERAELSCYEKSYWRHGAGAEGCIRAGKRGRAKLPYRLDENRPLRIKGREMWADDPRYLCLTAAAFEKPFNAATGAIKGYNHQMGRWQRQHVTYDAIHMIVTKSVAVSHHAAFGLQNGSGKVAEKLGIGVECGFDILRCIRKIIIDFASLG